MNWMNWLDELADELADVEAAALAATLASMVVAQGEQHSEATEGPGADEEATDGGGGDACIQALAAHHSLGPRTCIRIQRRRLTLRTPTHRPGYGRVRLRESRVGVGCSGIPAGALPRLSW